MWVASPGGADPLLIQFEFDQVYKLHQMLVWNYNVQFELLLGFGIKTATVEYSEDGTDWAVLGDVELAQGTARSDYGANTTVDLDGVAAQYVRLIVNSGFGLMGQFGLSEVRFLHIPAHAREPQPADGAADVSVAAALVWRAGREAVSHEVYFSTDETAVAEGSALIDTTGETAVDPGPLDLGVTYFWKVNEVNQAEGISTWEGDVWSFATQAHLVVDDFESYDDEENRIYDTWLDGWVNDTGSTVGHLESPFAERTILHGGSQSMPLFYDNTGTATSETELTVATQDWTANGVLTLSLYFRGAAGNSGQLYIKINSTKVPYDGDSTDIARTLWQPWNIDLSTVGGSPSNVTKLTIGIEGAGAKGVVYIDDIRLYPNAVEYLTPTEPDAGSLLALYALDGNVADSSGNGYDGTENGGPTYGTGVDGQAIRLDGIGDFVDFGVPENWPSGAASRTLCAWAQTSSVQSGWRVIAAYGSPVTAQAAGLVMNGTSLYASGYGSDVSLDNFWAVEEWHHASLTYDGATVRLYADGVEVASGQRTWNTTITVARIGRQVNEAPEFWDGMVDDVRLYDEALSAEEIAWLAGKRAPMHKPF